MSYTCECQAGALSRGSMFLVCICFILSGCARQLTPFGRARKADTIEAYEEFVRNYPQDPRARFARDRIEVLRLLEAHRSGNVPMAAPNMETSEQRVADRAAPTSVRQGPWNLAASPPRSSSFILDLYHGGEAPVPHKLRIDQQGEQVTYTLQHGSGLGGYYLTAGIPFVAFRRLWGVVAASEPGAFRPSYGRMVSPEDYRGNLIIEVDTGTERLSRMTRLEGMNFADENLTSLLRAMAEMHPGDHRMPFLR